MSRILLKLRERAEERRRGDCEEEKGRRGRNNQEGMRKDYKRRERSG